MPIAGRAPVPMRGGRLMSRAMFATYLVFTLVGLAYVIVVGLLRL